MSTSKKQPAANDSKNKKDVLELAMEKGKSKTPEREIIEVALNFVKPGSPQQAISPKDEEQKNIRFPGINPTILHYIIYSIDNWSIK